MGLGEPTQSDQVIQQLLEENSKLLKEIHATTERTRRYILVGEILSVVKILIIVIPIVLGFIYLRPYVLNAFSSYQELLGAPAVGTSNSLQPLDLLEELKKLQPAGGN